ncbi:MAG: iron-sulfur cluster assembly accessory protein [Rhodospirillales bacterium]|nr:iron-sulfur cluster assembly accessory protein [Rhodospirillales bacterium]
MVAISESAKSVIRRLIDQSKDGATGLRIMVEQGGCAGMQYKLGLDTSANADDEVYEFDGVKLFVDPLSLPIIEGMNIDFVDSLETSGFVFDNPNAGNTCSCGKSFS